MFIPHLTGCPAVILAGGAYVAVKDHPDFRKAVKQMQAEFAELADFIQNPKNSYLDYSSLYKGKVKPNGKEKKYSKQITKASKLYGVPEARIYAVIRAESAFNPTAKSHAGAIGLMQLMPATAKELGVKDPYNPAQNIRGGTKYLKVLYIQYKDWDLTHAAYNAGPGNVKKYNNKIPPFKETRNYVKRVGDYYQLYRTTSI